MVFFYSAVEVLVVLQPTNEQIVIRHGRPDHYFEAIDTDNMVLHPDQGVIKATAHHCRYRRFLLFPNLGLSKDEL
jgi:hypothetical protein